MDNMNIGFGLFGSSIILYHSLLKLKYLNKRNIQNKKWNIKKLKKIKNLTINNNNKKQIKQKEINNNNNKLNKFNKEDLTYHNTYNLYDINIINNIKNNNKKNNRIFYDIEDSILILYNIDLINGFLPFYSPLQKLNIINNYNMNINEFNIFYKLYYNELEYFNIWENIINDLPALIATGNIRNVLNGLKPISIDPLLPEWARGGCSIQYYNKNKLNLKNKNDIKIIEFGEGGYFGGINMKNININNIWNDYDNKNGIWDDIYNKQPYERKLYYYEQQQRRAHFILCLLAHAYVWGGDPIDYIPEGIAIPLWELSNFLGIPPVLTQMDIVLYNWRKIDPNGPITLDNITTINQFLGGWDEAWFYLDTVEIEARGAEAIKPLLNSCRIIKEFNQKYEKNQILDNKNFNYLNNNNNKKNIIIENNLQFPSPPLNNELSDFLNNNDLGYIIKKLTNNLNIVKEALNGMNIALERMVEGCLPYVFYHRVRAFLAAWKNNPTLPDGVEYCGIPNKHQFYGGSAAQSTLIPVFDISLGVDLESTKSVKFLKEMRNYMPKQHREYLDYIETLPSLYSFVKNIKLWKENNSSSFNYNNYNLNEYELNILFETYNNCIELLHKFRNQHMKLVSEYIIIPQRNERLSANADAGNEKNEMKQRNDSYAGTGQSEMKRNNNNNNNNSSSSENKKGMIKRKSTFLGQAAGGKGTGGTDLVTFLKPLRDIVKKIFIN